MGRPEKLTGDAETELLGALKAGADIVIAASIAGVSPTTVYNKLKRSVKFAERVAYAKAIADDVIVRRLYQAALDGDVKAMTFWLKNRRAKTWRDRQELQVDGDIRSYTVTTRRRESAPEEPEDAPDPDAGG